MARTGVISVDDGPTLTVDYLLGNPLWVPAKILSILDNGWISETLLRDEGGNADGIVGFEESRPLFLGKDVEDVAEFAEIPVASGERGLPRIVTSTLQALGIRCSERMRRSNKMGEINAQIDQLTNTMLRAEERALRRAFSNPRIPTIPASAPWDAAGSKIRHDLAQAQEAVGAAKPDGATEGDETFAFEANTVVFPGNIVPTLLDNDEFLKVYSDTLSDQNIAYTGKMPGQVLGMEPLKSRSWPSDRVLVLERKRAGFYSDTRKLEATGMYPEGGGGNGGPTETWRSDVTKQRVIGVDQPLSACWITGIRS